MKSVVRDLHQVSFTLRPFSRSRSDKSATGSLLRNLFCNCL